MKHRKPPPPVTVRYMSDEELAAAQEKMKRKAGIRPRKRGDMTDENRRKIDAGETFRSQYPSRYRRKMKRK